MSLSVEKIRRIARLARLELSSEEEQLYRQQLAEVVDYIGQLQGFEVEAVDPLEREPVEAEDVPAGDSLLLSELLDNAPASLDRFVLVPQVKRSEGG